MRFPDLSKELDYSGGCCDWNRISSAEKYFPEINNQVFLWTPHDWYKLMPLEKVVIGVYFKNLLEIKATAKSAVKYIPDKVECWGKMCFKNDTECVRSCWVHELVREMHWDASYARLDLVIDEYKDNAGRSAQDK